MVLELPKVNLRLVLLVNFLKMQELITYIKDEDKIKPTTRFTVLMNHYFLDEDRKTLIESLLLERREL